MKAKRQYKESRQDSIQPKRERTKLNFEDKRVQSTSQTKLINSIQKNENDYLQRMVIQLADWYVYGNGSSTPHVHCYSGGDSHLQISDRGRVRRYNIIQNSEVHVQATDALRAARESGDDELVSTIQDLINAVTGEKEVESSESDDDDSESDDFPSMDAMWKTIGWNFKKGSVK